MSPTPLESDVEVSKVDTMVPPSIDTQLIDGVALLDDQGDDKVKEKQPKGDGDLLKTIFAVVVRASSSLSRFERYAGMLSWRTVGGSGTEKHGTTTMKATSWRKAATGRKTLSDSTRAYVRRRSSGDCGGNHRGGGGGGGGGGEGGDEGIEGGGLLAKRSILTEGCLLGMPMSKLVQLAGVLQKWAIPRKVEREARYGRRRSPPPPMMAMATAMTTMIITETTIRPI